MRTSRMRPSSSSPLFLVVYVVSAAALAPLGGCASAPGYMDPTAPSGVGVNMDAARSEAAGDLTESLFQADQAVLSNQDIDKILSAKVRPPADARVAVIRLGQRYPWPWWWSEDLAQLDQQTMSGLMEKLRGSERVSEVLLVPSMLTPPVMSVPYLREAAARMQADTLLVYRTESQAYQRSESFKKDQTRAYCTVEAILLDTRTGIVTTTSVAREDFSAKRSRRDLSTLETAARAEQEALSRALATVGDDLVRYLDSGEARAGAETERSRVHERRIDG